MSMAATPMKVLHSLVTVMVRCAEPWRPPAHSMFQVAKSLFMSGVTLPDFFGPSSFVDAAWDSFGFRMGGVIPRRGVRSRMVQERITNQREAELQGVAWAVRLAYRFGWRAMTIFTDSTSAGCQAALGLTCGSSAR